MERIYKGANNNEEKITTDCKTSEGLDGNCSLGLQQGDKGYLGQILRLFSIDTNTPPYI